MRFPKRVNYWNDRQRQEKLSRRDDKFSKTNAEYSQSRHFAKFVKIICLGKRDRQGASLPSLRFSKVGALKKALGKRVFTVLTVVVTVSCESSVMLLKPAVKAVLQGKARIAVISSDSLCSPRNYFPRDSAIC